MSELAEGARLEIVYAPKGYLGFESPSLRQTYPASLFQARFDMAPLEAAHRPCGGVAEWLNAAVSKTVSPVLPVTRVRIPPPPPFSVPIYSRIQAPFSLFTLALVSSLTQSVARSPFLPQRCRQYDIIPPCATEFASANFDNFRVSPVQLFVTIC